MGAEQTLREMLRLTIEAIHSQQPRMIAVSLIGDHGAEDPEIFVDVLRGWLRTHITIVDEFEELLQSPILMIDEVRKNGVAYADCDDVSMLAASIIASIGGLVRYAAVFPQPDGSFSHVIVQYKFPRQAAWRNFDATIDFRGTYPPDMLLMDVIS